MTILGFSSGLPLALTAGTLQAWATVDEVSLQKIGLLTLVGAAYTLKFLWAPLLDRYAPPFFNQRWGRRRGWILAMQVLLALTIMLMGTLQPSKTLLLLATLAVLVAFFSASHDIVFDAYGTELLRIKERGLGTTLKVLGFRFGMAVSGGLALVMADRWFGWGATYFLMGLLMLICTIGSFLASDPEKPIQAPASIVCAITEPIKEYFQRRGALMMLWMIVLYKMGDAFAGALTSTFLIRGIGFSATEVGVVNNVLGILTSILGAILGTRLIERLGLYRSLMSFGILQAVSNLAYWGISISVKNIWLMTLAVSLENLCGGLGLAALVMLLMALCDQRFTVMQFALLSSLAAIGRTYVAGPFAPPMVNYMGWSGFYVMTVLIALPGLVLLWHNRAAIQDLGKKDPSH